VGRPQLVAGACEPCLPVGGGIGVPYLAITMVEEWA